MVENALRLNNIIFVVRDKNLYQCTDIRQLCYRDVQNRFLNFGSVSVLEKNSDSVRNEFGSVCKNSVRFR